MKPRIRYYKGLNNWGVTFPSKFLTLDFGYGEYNYPITLHFKTFRDAIEGVKKYE